MFISLRNLVRQRFAYSIDGTSTTGHFEDKHGIFPESIWSRSLCVSNNALAAHMTLTSMNLSKSFFILFIFVAMQHLEDNEFHMFTTHCIK